MSTGCPHDDFEGTDQQKQQTKHQQLEFGKRETNKSLALASILSLSLAFSMMTSGPAFADGQTEKFRLPPIDKSDKTRCTLNSSTIGQANAARDKLYDLRECNLSGARAVGFDLSGVIMTKTDVSKVNFQDAMFSKGYLQGTYMQERLGCRK
jgi:uncharacterized protein YjbI with pentapeptide repeats